MENITTTTEGDYLQSNVTSMFPYQVTNSRWQPSLGKMGRHQVTQGEVAFSDHRNDRTVNSSEINMAAQRETSSSCFGRLQAVSSDQPTHLFGLRSCRPIGSSLDKQKDISGPTYLNERLYATSLDVTSQYHRTIYKYITQGEDYS